jgi:hypothetical protein
MFVSVEEAEGLTLAELDAEIIYVAQGIIEVHVGRTEADVDNARDLAQLARAVAYQAAYMVRQRTMIFEQVDLKTMTVGHTGYNFRNNNSDAPFIAPLAVKACNKLSWRKARSVKTGRLGLPTPQLASWWKF